MEFEMDIDNEVSELKRIRKAMRKDAGPLSRRRQSRLDPHRVHLVALYRAGASLDDLVVWLRRHKRIEVHRTTVHKRMIRWGEVKRG